MMRRPVGWFPFVVIAALGAAPLIATGCRGLASRAVPSQPPNARAFAPADDPGTRGKPAVAALSPVSDVGEAENGPMRRPREILALSGGGSFGAYSAGFLSGWTKSGTRPEFDVVTGVSTGSLIAPFAFLGPEYDGRLGRFYTQVQAADIFRIRAWVTIPFKDAAASSAPLKQLLESEITPELMNLVAAEHRKGRRLYVGTTNLNTRRMVVWDMGAIACRPCPEACHLFRDVLLASSAVPGMLPPVRFEVEVDGVKVTELHADGGITAQLFVPSPVFAAAAQGAIQDAGKPNAPLGNDPMPPAGNLYVVVAGKLYPDASPVRPKVLPVLGATTSAILYAHCRADLSNLYGLSRAAGLKYHLTSLRQEFRTVENSVDFDHKEMLKLFEEGVRQSSTGPAWMSGPPALSPGDGDPIRTGLKMRTPGMPVGIPMGSGN